MKLGANIEGLDQLNANLKALAKSYGREVAKAIYKGALLMQGEAIRSIQTLSPGVPVTRYKKTAGGAVFNKRDHIAAAAGQAPNTDTGRLVASIQVDAGKNDAYVGSTLPYAGKLEFGTRQMGARPWLNPALDKSRPVMKKLVSDAVKAVKK